MKTSIRFSLLLGLRFAVAPNKWAEVRLAGIFADYMVLQRERPIQVGGWADKGEEVTIEFAGQTAVDADWQRCRNLGITAVPPFVVGSSAVVGAQPYDVLESLVVNGGAVKW